MKLLYYSREFPPQIGGIETFSVRLLEGLKAHNREGSFEITAVTQTASSLNGSNPLPAVSVIRCPSLLQLWVLIGKCDMLLLAGPAIAPLSLALIRNKRFLVSHHNYQCICPNGLLFHLGNRKDCPGYFRRKNFAECTRCSRKELSLPKTFARLMLTFVRNFLTRFADRNVCVSEHLNERLRLPNSVVIRNGIPDIPARMVDSATSRFNSSSPFVFIGRLVVEKGVDVLVRACDLLKRRGIPFSVLIVGDGPERCRLEDMILRMGLAANVQLLGFKSGADLERILSDPCTLVMPSICQDVAPFAPLEHMVRARPVIASDIGGLSAEVGNSGLRFPPGSEERLADHMETVIRDPQLAERLGNEARKRVLDQYGYETMITEYLKVLRGDADLAVTTELED